MVREFPRPLSSRVWHISSWKYGISLAHFSWPLSNYFLNQFIHGATQGFFCPTYSEPEFICSCGMVLLPGTGWIVRKKGAGLDHQCFQSDSHKIVSLKVQNILDIHTLDFFRLLELPCQAIWLSRMNFLLFLELIKMVQTQTGPFLEIEFKDQP